MLSHSTSEDLLLPDCTRSMIVADILLSSSSREFSCTFQFQFQPKQHLDYSGSSDVLGVRVGAIVVGFEGADDCDGGFEAFEGASSGPSPASMRAPRSQLIDVDNGIPRSRGTFNVE